MPTHTLYIPNPNDVGFELPGFTRYLTRFDWADLEPVRGQYNLNPIIECLDRSAGPTIILIRDKSFGNDPNPNPQWLMDMNHAVRYGNPAAFNQGWISCRWRSEVSMFMTDLHKEVHELGHPRLAGTMTQETAPGLTRTQQAEYGFDTEAYSEALYWQALDIAAHGPLWWLWNYGGGVNMADLCFRVQRIDNVRMGGPDILPDPSSSDTSNSLHRSVYPIYPRITGPKFCQASWDTHLQVDSAEEARRFAVEVLGCDEIQWVYIAPDRFPNRRFYTVRDVVPIAVRDNRINIIDRLITSSQLMADLNAAHLRDLQELRNQG